MSLKNQNCASILLEEDREFRCGLSQGHEGLHVNGKWEWRDSQNTKSEPAQTGGN
ncbi:MAG: hypothetical protein JWQ87_2275 [Candidatus Sulfotelmatobacter sp.]|nr:hypothetical protein [Candidatus Sulfotelmatobacter sp.]